MYGNSIDWSRSGGSRAPGASEDRGAGWAGAASEAEDRASSRISGSGAIPRGRGGEEVVSVSLSPPASPSPPPTAPAQSLRPFAGSALKRTTGRQRTRAVDRWATFARGAWPPPWATRPVASWTAVASRHRGRGAEAAGDHGRAARWARSATPPAPSPRRADPPGLATTPGNALAPRRVALAATASAAAPPPGP